MKKEKLENVFDDAFNNGIFDALETFNVPWKNIVDASVLDIEYFGNISGSKRISPLISKILEKDNANVLSQARISQIAEMLYFINHENWEREWATLLVEYNPVNNYDMTETSTETTERDVSQSNTGTQEFESNDTTNNGVYGFNSETAVNSDETIETGSTTRTDDLSQSLSDDSTVTRELHRSGNIGVTTTQQMLQSERDLYTWNFFYKIVFPALDKILTLPLY